MPQHTLYSFLEGGRINLFSMLYWRMERIKWEDFLKTFCSYRQLLRPVLPLCLPLLTLCLPQTGRQAAKAQKAVDQIQGKLKTAENQLNKANSNLSKKDTDFQNAKEAVASSNDKVTSVMSYWHLKHAQSEL